MRVLVALSGGVDSAVTAARMVDAGYDVSAVHLALKNNPAVWREGASGCGSPTDSEDARSIAEMLGIGFEVWDFSDRFVDNVVDYFLGEYSQGRTPNPCIRCNRTIKFGALLDRAIELGFDKVATGHYAVVKDVDGEAQLFRADNPAKDQSYVLSVLTQHQLSHVMLPVGHMNKPELRKEAEARGLPVFSKPDSLDICFIDKNDTQGFLKEKLGSQPGEIVDTSGQVLGTHDGAYQFTVGQRKGLRLSQPAPDGQPRYVVRVDAPARRVVVAGADDLVVDRLECIDPTWNMRTPPTGTRRADVQFRAHGRPVPATIQITESGTIVDFDEPVRGVAPGQYAVAYDGDRALGNATIAATSSRMASTSS